MITVVIGKPGTGKSYHCVRYLAAYLTTLARKHKIERRIFTNLSLNLDALQKYFDSRRIKIDVKEVVTILGHDDLIYDESLLERGERRLVRRGNKEFLEIESTSKAFFWNRFPDNALIVIDEIQKYLSNIKEVGDSEEQSLVEYFSLHRHKKHDWIFLTQNLQSLSLSVRKVSEKVVECLNSKSLTLPFPFSIPLRDIQTLLLGFGINNQVYRVREGRLDGSWRVEYDGPIEAVVMRQEIFDLYQTHTLLENSESIGVTSDSEIPFDLGPGAWRRSVLWFIRKHWLHLTLKLCAFILCLNLLNSFFNFMKDPSGFAKYLSSNIASEISSGVDSKPSGKSSKSSVVKNKKGEIVGILDSKNSNKNNFIKQKEISAPIIQRVIFSDEVIENGSKIEIGSISADGRRVLNISPRYGVEYEASYLLYVRLYDELDRFSRWLRWVRIQKRLDECSADLSDGSDVPIDFSLSD